MLQKGFQVSRVKMPAGDPNHGKDAVLVFTIELVRIFVTINRASSVSLHCCLLMENPPGIRIINNTVINVLHHYQCGLPLEKFDICIVICIVELSIASNLLSVCKYTLSSCFHWNLVLVFTVELVRILLCYHQ